MFTYYAFGPRVMAAHNLTLPPLRSGSLTYLQIYAGFWIVYYFFHNTNIIHCSPHTVQMAVRLNQAVVFVYKNREPRIGDARCSPGMSGAECYLTRGRMSRMHIIVLSIAKNVIG